ncbi:MAG TPA: hypothetical protein VLJ11_22375 [Bryobacteraceae bacterium]|nr:hypothetical protein [Bryobacteraceae bacterium]
MSIQGLLNIKKAVSKLNPKDARDLGERQVHIALYGSNPLSYERMEDFFLRELSPARRQQSAASFSRDPHPATGLSYDLSIYDENAAAPSRALIFEPTNPERLVQKILDTHHDLGVSLAKAFPPFRDPFVNRVIGKVSKENTLFSLTTALPDVIPNILELPWAVAEFASDSAFLTMNQIRMAFLIAAASDREIGYREQKSEVAAIIGSAFGWRALARQVVGKIPFGGGLIGKAAIAYAGTKVVGLSLDRFYRMGYHYTKAERESLYMDAFRQGKNVAGRILSHLRPDLAARQAEEEEKPTIIVSPGERGGYPNRA